MTISVTPSQLSNGFIGKSYSQQEYASGGTAPYTYAVTAGTLPAGITLTSAGLLSGTPTTLGTYSFTITATDSLAATGSTAYSLLVATAVPIQTASANANSTFLTFAFTTQNVTPGSTLVLIVNSQASAPTGVTDTQSGDVINTRVAWGGYNALTSIAVYDVINTSGGAKTSFTITCAASQKITAVLAEYAGSVATAFDQVTAIATGLGTTITTASLTPAIAGELAIAAGCFDYYPITWSNGYLQEKSQNSSGGISPYTLLADQVLATTAAISVSGSSAASAAWSAVQLLYKPAPAAPTVSSVNSGATIVEGATGVAVVGTGFVSGMTSNILQPGSVSVAQTTTYVSATSATFNLIMEPGSGDQLAFTDSTFTATYTVTDSGGTSTAVAVNLAPATGYPFITLTSINSTSSYDITALPSLAAGDQLEASGNGTGSVAAPTGLVLNADATWYYQSGYAAKDFYVRAYDGVNKVWGAWALQTIAAAVIAVAPSTLPNPTAEFAYSQTITASGGASPYTYAVTAGALPAGLTLASGGAISGTPTTLGAYSFTITATDANLATGSLAYSVTTVAPTISVFPSTLPDATFGVAYSQTITAAGGVAPYTYAVTAGTLPTGITLSSGGVLSGTPTVSGVFSFTITATDAGSYTGSTAYSLYVDINATVAVTDPADVVVLTATQTNSVIASVVVTDPADVVVLTGTGTSPVTDQLGAVFIPAFVYNGIMIADASGINPQIYTSVEDNTVRIVPQRGHAMSRITANFNKSPAEIKRYLIDLSASLAPGESIATIAPPTVTSPSGELSPTLVVKNVLLVPVTSGQVTQASYYASLGTSGQNYEVDFLITTTLGEVYEIVIAYVVQVKV